MRKVSDLTELLETCPKNGIIADSFVKAWSIINNKNNEKILCSISGGADSDVMLDLIWRVDISNKVNYVWFNTGMEYQATKDHLKELEEKYEIGIIREKAILPVPTGCKKYGLPFVSKRVSNLISRLQSHNFRWEDGEFAELLQKYPNCKCALLWWCNQNTKWLNIDNNVGLKEFLIQNPPQFRISDGCCKYAKKEVGNTFVKKGGYQIRIEGLRKAEGGLRSIRHSSCFSSNKDTGVGDYRPLFWYKNEDKSEYESAYGIVHSKCYSEYGLKRTGCVGCPFGRNFETELEACKTYEPKLLNAAQNVFGESYEYTKKYREFVKQLKVCSRKEELWSD